MPLLLPNKYVRAAPTIPLGRSAVTLEHLSMEEILNGVYYTDAHMLLYEPADEKAYPVRYRKRSGAANHLQTEWLAFDYDLPGHRVWKDEDEVALITDRLLEDCKGDFYAIYTTPHGARLILRLPEPHPVLNVEALHKQLLAEVFTADEYDKACSDWTRAFRLPYVVRDDVKLWEEPLTELVVAGNVSKIRVPKVLPESTKVIVAISSTAPSDASKKLVWLEPD